MSSDEQLPGPAAESAISAASGAQSASPAGEPTARQPPAPKPGRAKGQRPAPEISDWRVRSARWVLLAVAIGAFVLFQRSLPSSAQLAFEVPPTFRHGAASSVTRDEVVPRAAVRAIDGQVFERHGAQREELARVHFAFATPLTAPVTHAAALRLPRGEYEIRARVTLRDGRVLLRDAALEIEGDGLVRVPLDP